MVIVGSSDADGSWNTMPTSLPRIDSMDRSDRLVSSVPASMMDPAVIKPPAGSRRRTERAVIVLPPPARGQARDRACRHRLAAACPPPQAEAFAGRHRERDAVDRAHRRVLEPD